MKIIESIKKHRKQILYILLLYATWSIAVFLGLAWLQGFEKTSQQFGQGYGLYFNLIHTILKGTIVFYFLIYHLAIPLIMERKWKKILTQTLVFFVLLTVYEYIFDFKTGRRTPVEQGDLTLFTYFLTMFILDLLLIFMSYFIAILITGNEIRKRKEELEKEKLKAELAAIKYQINPHFLFNSLSFIYTKSIKSSPEAAHAVHLLSEIMSYALSERDELGAVPLSQEIEQMKKVIEMNQIRFNNNLKIKFHEEIEPNDAQVPILSLVTLVENAFKHGDLTDEKNQVSIVLKATTNRIHFMVSNKKKKGPKEPSNGIGLNNVQQRLQLMYGIRHTFVIREDENYFLNEIIINL